MALSLGSGIDYQGTENNFARDRFVTLADMVAKPAKNLPKMFISLCEETGKAYLYNKNNEADPELGKWRPLVPETGAGSGASSNPIVILTAAEYEELAEKDPNTVYLIKE